MLYMQTIRASLKRSLAPLALLAFEAGAVAVLDRLGSLAALRLPPPTVAAWEEWLRSGNPADVLAAIVRLATLGAAWWLLVSTVLYSAAGATRKASALRVIGWGTPALVRRCVDGMVAVSVAGVLAGGRTGVASAEGMPRSPAGGAATAARSPDLRPGTEAGIVLPADADTLARPHDLRPGTKAGIVLPADIEHGIVFPPGATRVAPTPAAPAPHHDQVVPGGALAPAALLPASPPLATPPSPSEAAVVPPKATEGQQAPEPPGASGLPGVPLSAGDAREGSAAWIVQPGESLWTIAARTVSIADAAAGAPDPDRIGPYWIRVVEANRRSIASGHPDLIRPGESIALPSLARDGR